MGNPTNKYETNTEKSQRDERGLFLKGNNIAAGNKGNTFPKFGNQNALKHGLFATVVQPVAFVEDSGNLYTTNGISQTRIKPEGFYQDENGRIWVRDDVAEVLEMNGFKLESI